MNVGIVGLGIMGTAFSKNLLASGFSVSGTDVDTSRVEALITAGGQKRASARDVAAASDVVITSLPNAGALDEVATGLAEGSYQGLIVIETSTLPLEAKLRVRDILKPQGVAVIDAPVSGTGSQAADAQIIVYASGDSAAIRLAMPVFDAIGKATHDLGEFGNGSRMKYVANLLVSVHNLAAAEAFVLGMKAGLEPQQMLDVVLPGAGNSKILELRGPMMVADQYEEATARLRQFLNDIEVIGGSGRDIGVPTPLLDASLPLYEEAVASGLGELDVAALCRLLERKAGHER